MRALKTMSHIVSQPHILLSRTDNLGDIILTLPMAWHLKQHFPDCYIGFLCRPYAQELVAHCPFIDEVLLYDPKAPKQHIIQTLRQTKFDAILHVYPRKDIAFAARNADIATRIGTSHRWYHWLTCNNRVAYSRAKSHLHESLLNLPLLAPLGITTVENPKDIPLLTPKTRLSKVLQNRLDPSKFNLILQPLSNGNGREWPMAHFIALTQALLKTNKVHILLNGAPNEAERLTELAALLPKKQHLFDISLNDKVIFFAACDGMVSNSTGPMHIAAALGIHTLGLFPPKPTMDPKRWRPIGAKAEYMVMDKPCDTPCSNTDCTCMRDLSVQQVITRIERWLTAKA